MPTTLTGQVWGVYYQEVRLRCPGVPEPLMDHHLRLASREFLRRTLMWERLIGPMTLTISQNLYSLGKALVLVGNDWPIETGDAPMECVKLKKVEYVGGYVKERSQQWLDANWPNWQFTTGRLPMYWFLFNSLTLGQGIRFVPTPTETIADLLWITATLANPFVPGSATTALNYDFNPELPFKYQREIAAGAISKLALLMDANGKPFTFTNPAIASLAMNEFEEAVSKMILKTAKDGTRMSTIAAGGRVGFA